MFDRDHHRAIATVLDALNHEYFRARQCYFGGGTLLTLDFHEFRESVDVDLLISDPVQIGALRRDLHGGGYSVLFSEVEPGFEFNPDQPRTTRDKVIFAVLLPTYARPIKVEIIFEERIALDAARDVMFTAMPCLSIRDSIAGKLLANADRGRDTAYFAKDLVDLAIVVTDPRQLEDAIEKVHTSPRGYDVDAPLRATVRHFRDNPFFRRQCYKQLQISTPRDIADGVDRLAQYLDMAPVQRLLEEEPEIC